MFRRTTHRWPGTFESAYGAKQPRCFSLCFRKKTVIFSRYTGKQVCLYAIRFLEVENIRPLGFSDGLQQPVQGQVSPKAALSLCSPFEPFFVF
jgi:hypothetical protein